MACIVCLLIQPILDHISQAEYFLNVYSLFLRPIFFEEFSLDDYSWSQCSSDVCSLDQCSFDECFRSQTQNMHVLCSLPPKKTPQKQSLARWRGYLFYLKYNGEMDARVQQRRTYVWISMMPYLIHVHSITHWCFRLESLFSTEQYSHPPRDHTSTAIEWVILGVGSNNHHESHRPIR